MAEPNSIMVGDALACLRELPDGYVQTCVTSPPYWGLRDYGTARWEGGKAECAHRVGGKVQDSKAPGAITGGVRPGVDASRCLDCGARRIDQQLGLERTPEEYVERIVRVFREIRRVLRPDGTLWLNMGDSFIAGGRGGDTGASGLEGSTDAQDESKRAREGAGPRIGHRSSFRRDRAPRQDEPHKSAFGLKPKDLVGMPWRVAFALQADGWWLRMDNIYAKRSPMPESVEDRCTKSHEYVFLLAKSERYYYDAFAIREPLSGTANGRGSEPACHVPSGWDLGPGHHHTKVGRYRSGNKKRKVAESGQRGRLNTHLGSSVPWTDDGQGRNKRSVWWLSTEPFPLELCRACRRSYDRRPPKCVCGADDRWVGHFATFPQDLVRPCILAGTSEKGACARCGAPWERIVERPDLERSHEVPRNEADGGRTAEHGFNRTGMSHLEVAAWLEEHPPRTAGWSPSCRCGVPETVPCLVLDPFIGTGTTGLVALKAGRRFLGIELNPDYAEMAERRIWQEKHQARLV